MKLIGRIVAVLIAAVVSVLMVQQVIRRVYQRLGGRYITLRTGACDGEQQAG